LQVISARARGEGIRTFSALMLFENHAMRDLLERLAPVRVLRRACGTVEVEVPIPPVRVAPALRELLRDAARHTPPAKGGRDEDVDPSAAGIEQAA
jgi:hypothetical protein